jgi:hypothetical protein
MSVTGVPPHILGAITALLEEAFTMTAVWAAADGETRGARLDDFNSARHNLERNIRTALEAADKNAGKETLRDRFAIAALAVLADTNWSANDKDTARWAYELANAMLDEKSRQK